MHLSTTLITFIITFASATPLPDSEAEPIRTLFKRGCFTSGESWGIYQGVALNGAESACSAALGNNALYNGSAFNPLIYRRLSQLGNH